MATRTTTPKRRRWPPETVELINELAAKGKRPAEIERALRGELAQTDVPTLRTIERMIAEDLPASRAEPWSLASNSGGEAAAVLAALAELLVRTEGRLRQISVGDAEWIRAIHFSAPDLHPWWAYRLARLYSRATGRGEPTDGLDAWLALAPWRSPSHRKRYEELVASGLPGAGLSLPGEDAQPPDAEHLLDSDEYWPLLVRLAADPEVRRAAGRPPWDGPIPESTMEPALEEARFAVIKAALIRDAQDRPYPPVPPSGPASDAPRRSAGPRRERQELTNE